MSRRRALLLLAALGVGAFLAYRWFFPPNEALIRRLLTKVVATVTIAPGAGNLERLAAANRLVGFFVSEVDLRLPDAGLGPREIHGDADLREAAVTAFGTVRSLEVQLNDVAVAIGTQRQTATAQIIVTVRVDGAAETHVQELRLTLVKLEGRWRIAKVEPVRTLGM